MNDDDDDGREKANRLCYEVHLKCASKNILEASNTFVQGHQAQPESRY